MPRLPLLLSFLGLLLLTLTACEDPSNVGLNLVGEQGGEPFNRVVPPETVDNAIIPDLTGNTAFIPLTLAGRVEDPLLGTVEATGNIDFLAPASTSDAFKSGTVTEVTLEMVINYVYGDTTQPLVLALHDIPQAWNADGVHADTVIQATPAAITEVTFSPTDSLVTVALPEGWIAANDAVLRSGSFDDDFHGFQFVWRGGNSVVGLTPGGFRMQVSVGEETETFSIAQSVSSLRRPDAPALGPEWILLQDGTGLNVELSFDFASEELLNHAVHRARLRLPTDTLLHQDTPPGFVRPRLETVSLLAVTPDDITVEIMQATLDEQGRFVFESEGLLNVFQSLLLEEDLFDRLRLTVPTDRNTISPAILKRDPADPSGPAAVLTLTSPDG